MPGLTSITLDDVPVLSGRGEDQGWKLYAACYGQDPDIWYPERGQDVRPAKKVCAVCPARMACLSYALRNGERLGIWGGLTERERRRMRRGLSLSVSCIYCGRIVKAGGLSQQTCNRQACKSRFAAGDEPTLVNGELFEAEDLELIEVAEDVWDEPIPAWVAAYEVEQLLLFPAPPGDVVVLERRRRRRDPHTEDVVEQLTLDVYFFALVA